MAEHDYVIANQNGANTRSDLNNALAAIVSNNSKATAPSTTYAYMWWADTAADILKQRNGADSAWINILTLSTGAPLADYADNALSGNAIDGGTISNFTSTGIDDNATSTAITIDSSENVGIGVVPESWFGNQTALQIGGTGAALSADIGAAYYSNNAYRDSSGNWKRVGSGYATRNMLYNGVHYFDVAGTSTADSAITWTTAMTIDNGGTVKLGSYSAVGATNGVNLFSGNVGLISSRDGTGSQGHAYYYNANGNVGSIQTSGTSTSFNTSSDYRLKENVVPMTGSIDRLKELKPSRFNFIADADTTVDGFLAHEAGEVVPECASGTKDAMMDEEYEVTPAVMDGETVVTEAVMGTRSVPDYQGIDQSKLVPLLVASLQEAVAKIEALEARVTALEV
jgi:hypothetical protein